MNGSVLVIGQDAELRDSVLEALTHEGFECASAPSGDDAMQRLERGSVPGLVVVDCDALPDGSGSELCRRIRQERRTRSVRVLLLSEGGDEVDRVVAFELGADDYVVKPFSLRELALRVRAILRRSTNGAESQRGADVIRFGRIRVDLAGHRVWVDEREVHLTVLEFRLLATLLSRRGRVEDRQRLVRDLWGRHAGVTARTVDTHVRHLRGKLGPVGTYIETVRGVGYRFIDQPEDH